MKLFSVVFALSLGSAVACDGMKTDYEGFKFIQYVVQSSECDVKYTRHYDYMKMSCGQYEMRFQFENDYVCVLEQKRIPEY